MYFSNASALHGEKRSEVPMLSYGFASANEIPQNSSIDLETSGENLDLGCEHQMSEVDEPVPELIIANQSTNQPTTDQHADQSAD